MVMANLPNLSPRDMLDIIFENRNRAYGAYALRREYPNHLLRALGYGLLLILGFLLVPILLRAVSSYAVETSVGPDIVYEPRTPPVIEMPKTPPPAETQPPPKASSIRFVPPAPIPDDKVPDETLPPDQSTLANTDDRIGTVTQAGDPDVPPVLTSDDGRGHVIEPQAPTPPDDIFNVPDLQKPPMFPGGEADLLKYLSQNIRYPEIARETGTQGVVAIQFVIGKDGSIEDVAIVKDIGSGCGKEAIRVVRNMPRWIPGEANGHPVKVRFTLPVRFKLQ